MGIDRDLARRVTASLAWALWFGGFTFYAVVAIPVGTEVLGGAVAQGFVTQRVTERLNLLGAFALVILAWNALPANPALPVRGRAVLRSTWFVLLACQVALFLLHPHLDRLLDPATRTVVEPDHFYGVHRVYLWVAIVQWFSGIAHFVAALSDWREHDRGSPARV